jgi:1-deoxy-D-xylulose-5-phosphate reductoisomerase
VKRKILILGSTGSIGKSCLDVVRANPGKFEVVGLSAQSNVKELAEQIREFKPQKVAIAHELAWKELKKASPLRTKILAGEHSPAELVKSLSPDVVVSAIVGAAGLVPTLAAIRKGIRVAIANKEPLVMAGKIMMANAAQYGATILPIDSEHSALWQCLNGEPANRINRLILTASGGPFLRTTARQMKKVTLAQALKHPRWKMGRKITIDSSTLMNKGLEVIEARWLFNVPVGKIEVVIHPQSIVHSMVEFADTSIMAQLGQPDMRVPIAYALSWPDRWPAKLHSLPVSSLGKLEFMPPDTKKFPCLALAYDALKAGGLAPAWLNAANEVAVQAFLDGRIGYADIPRIIGKTLERAPGTKGAGLKSILEADRQARETANGFLK